MTDPTRNLPAAPDTPLGEFPRFEYRLRLGGREWGILHTGEVLTMLQEQRYLSEPETRAPYGVVLWPAAIALAHDVAARAEAFRGRRVLELGAGTGLPGIVAASFGAEVVQTDQHALAMSVCRQNGERNGVRSIVYRQADWTDWDDTAQYDWIFGSDIIYGEKTQAALRRIFATNLTPGGRLLLADPFRKSSIRLLEEMEADGWTVAMAKWTVGEERKRSTPRAIGVFELTAPA